MKISEIEKHIVDCSLAFAISFLSLFVAMKEITFQIIMIAVCSSMLIALIKFREYWLKNVIGENQNISNQVHTIFF